MKFRKVEKWFILFLSLGLLVFSPPAMAKHHDDDRDERKGPPAWAPAHGYYGKHHHPRPHEVVYEYIYYPSTQVYYYPVERRYFWLEGNRWRMGVALPTTIHIGSSGVSLEMDTPTPYIYHTEVIRTYRVR